jgi:hypothetical protein
MADNEALARSFFEVADRGRTPVELCAAGFTAHFPGTPPMDLAGGNFIDTANKYHEGQSEEILGGFLGPDRDRFVVATKYTLAMGSGREGHLCRPVRRPGLGRVSSQHGGGPSRLEPVRCSAGRVQPARAHRRGGAAAGGRGLRPLGLCLGADGCRDPHRQVHRRHLDIPDRSWCLWQDSNPQPAV